jgi:single-strand DNA-binding protein
MTRSLNKVFLLGNVGNDPELRTTTGAGRVATFSLATSRTWSGPTGEKAEKTEWHRCVVWNTKTSTLADIVEKYVKKGDKLLIEGRIEYREWTDKEGRRRYNTEINVRELTLLGTPPARSAPNGSSTSAAPTATAAPNGGAPARQAAAPSATGGDDFEDFPGALVDDEPIPF